jgi:hypothetical protein
MLTKRSTLGLNVLILIAQTPSHRTVTADALASMTNACLSYIEGILKNAREHQEVLYSDGLAHFEQMQALFFASSGTRSRSSDERVAVMHQQDSGGFPVALEIS